MKAKGTQFHPSRDKRPTEYEPQGNDVYITGAGHYERDELENATASDRSYGDTDSPLLQPAQGRLFDAEKHEGKVREQLGRERFEPMNSGAAEIRDKAMRDSTIPTSHLQSRPGRLDTQLTTKNNESDWAGSGTSGWYLGPSTRDKADTIAIDPNSGHGTSNTMIHEMGHRRHLGERPAFADETTHPRSINPDPLKEGVADAYVDRYGGYDSKQVRPMREDIEAGGGQKFTSYQFTGYSSDPERAKSFGWNTDDQALYAAVRGHASETGEQALYTPRGRDVREQPGIADYGGGNPTTDATLHSLLSTSPHAAQALRQTGLKDAGARAFRRHRDRQLLTEGQSTQGSLFTELRGTESGKVHGYTPTDEARAVPLAEHMESFTNDLERVEASSGETVWPHHMSHNQFGEAPRTQAEISNSLGVSRAISKQQGFRER